MNPYEDEERRRRNGENLLRVTEEAKKADRNPRIKFPEILKKLPIKSLVIGGLIICACFIGLALSERINRIGGDVDRIKAQLGQVTSIESKLTQSVKENEQLKNEVAQIKTELEGIKAENQKRLVQEARATATKKAGTMAAKKPKRKP
jgi:hypothetical protein